MKQKLAVALNVMLEPMRERRAAYDAAGYIEELIYNGTQQVREETKQTLYEMLKAMGFTGVWNRIRRKAEKYTGNTPEDESIELT